MKEANLRGAQMRADPQRGRKMEGAKPLRAQMEGVNLFGGRR